MKARLLGVWLLASAMLISSCGSDPSRTTETGPDQNSEIPQPVGSGTTSDTEIRDVADADTVLLKDRALLFFGPSELRVQTILKKDPRSEIKSLVDSHKSAFQPVMDSVMKAGKPTVLYSEARYVKVLMRTGNTMIIDRYKLKSEVGFYMTDGLQVPVFRLGRLDAPVISRAVQQFFNP